jgi:hypothetical protein
MATASGDQYPEEEMLGFLQLLNSLCQPQEPPPTAAGLAGREALCTHHGVRYQQPGDLGYDFVYCEENGDFNGLIQDMTACAKQALGYSPGTARVTKRKPTNPPPFATTMIFEFLYQVATEPTLHSQFKKNFPSGSKATGLNAAQKTFLESNLPGDPYGAWAALQQLTTSAGQDDQELASSMNQLAVDFYQTYQYS